MYKKKQTDILPLYSISSCSWGEVSEGEKTKALEDRTNFVIK